MTRSGPKLHGKPVLECGAHIINDISAGEIDDNMLSLVIELNVPYIITHMQGIPSTMQKNLSIVMW